MILQLTPSSSESGPTITDRRTLLTWGLRALALSAVAVPGGVRAAVDPQRWAQILAQARGQSVYFNAWGGAPNINAYIQWAGERANDLYGLTVVHVKVSDASDVVQRVRSEKSSLQTAGTVDLVWINGANFLAMKSEGLLFGPFTQDLPAFALVDTAGKPTTELDFAEPVNGMEAPWGMAQLTFMVDSKRVAQPPLSLSALLDFASRNPGRVSYPRPPDFHGLTFLKQILLDTTPFAERAPLYRNVTPVAFARLTAGLWSTLDKLHPKLWRAGKQFPSNAASQRQMMADGELLFALTFNPNEAANEIASSRLSPSTISYQFASGTIGNTHFLAIPFNARSSAGAQVFANFLLGPEAQARKADISVWGDPTVLAIRRLPPAQRALFEHAMRPGEIASTMATLPEPHGSWVTPIHDEWIRRYGV